MGRRGFPSLTSCIELNSDMIEGRPWITATINHIGAKVRLAARTEGGADNG